MHTWNSEILQYQGEGWGAARTPISFLLTLHCGEAGRLPNFLLDIFKETQNVLKIIVVLLMRKFQFLQKFVPIDYLNTHNLFTGMNFHSKVLR